MTRERKKEDEGKMGKDERGSTALTRVIVVIQFVVNSPYNHQQHLWCGGVRVLHANDANEA